MRGILNKKIVAPEKIKKESVKSSCDQENLKFTFSRQNFIISPPAGSEQTFKQQISTRTENREKSNISKKFSMPIPEKENDCLIDALDNFDKIKNYKFYFVHNNFDCIMKVISKNKMKHRKSKRISHSHFNEANGLLKPPQKKFKTYLNEH